jgi:phage shock protein A
VLKRLSRVLRSWIGYFISFAEDPEVMLQESIEEMRNTLPKLNQVLVTTRATAIRLEQQKDELERKERALVGSIQVALREGSPEARQIAERDAMSLQEIRTELTATTEQFTAASHAFENAKLTTDDIKDKLRLKMEECRKAVQESQKAEVMRRAADALTELDTYGTAATAEKYLEQIRQKSAEAKASVEIASGGLDAEKIKLDRKARQIQASSILEEFEVQMGLRQPDATREAAPFPGTATPQATPTPQREGR